ncbi:superoxide reductase [Peptoniphilus sp. GNH]|nr:putative superoxide reductase [Clostridiales bacterium KA00134]UHR02499.1 superoxide reductase [Peptoniphilus sp. GNH]
MKLTQTVQSGDWAKEKHVPSLAVEKVEGGYKVRAEVGSEIAHPNTLEHHIAWIKVFFQKEGSKFPVEVGSYTFSAHGEEEVCSAPVVEAKVLTEGKGSFYALSYCNIHGLWENSVEC